MLIRHVYKMSDPLFHIKGDYIVLDYDGILIKYIKKDTINTISTTSNCLRVSLGKEDAMESILFTSLTSKDEFLEKLLDALSEKSFSTKHIIAKVNNDLTSCMRLIIDKLKNLKEEVRTDTASEIAKVMACVKELEQKVESLEDDKMPGLVSLDDYSTSFKVSDTESESLSSSEESECDSVFSDHSRDFGVEDILLTVAVILIVSPMILILMYALYVTTYEQSLKGT